MQKLMKIWIAALLAGLLAACGSSSDSEESGGSIKLDTYEVQSTAGTLSNGSPIIDTAIGNGEFTIHWEVSGVDSYTMEVYLSDDGSIATTPNLKLYGMNCGSSGIFSCGMSQDLSCQFGTDGYMSCDPSSIANPPINAGQYLNYLPRGAYFVLRVCNALATECKEEFRYAYFM